MVTRGDQWYPMVITFYHWQPMAKSGYERSLVRLVTLSHAYKTMDRRIQKKKTILLAVALNLKSQTAFKFRLIEHQRNINTLMLSSSNLRDQREVPKTVNYHETISRYSPDDFRGHFRLSRTSFEILCNKLHTCVGLRKKSGPSIDVQKDLLMFLWYIGNLESFRSMADRFGVSKSSYHGSIKRTTVVFIQDIMSEIIKWPQGVKVQETRNDFSEMSGFLNVIGAVDGSHIQIKAPKDHPNSYYNRKKFHSLVLLATCNAKLQFTYVWTGNPGSTHDATVLRSSELFQRADTLVPPGHYILGDSAFPLLGWLITPFRDYGNLTREQKSFNTRHSKSRQVIERSFGLLKCRFRRLLRFDASDMELMVDTILSACVLHNLCLELEEEYFEDDIGGHNMRECNDHVNVQGGHQMHGVRRRQEIMEHLRQTN